MRKSVGNLSRRLIVARKKAKPTTPFAGRPPESVTGAYPLIGQRKIGSMRSGRVLQSAATSAAFDYDKERAVPLRAHTYMRAVAAAWTRYRQEWSYYLHSATESPAEVEPIAMPLDRSHAEETIRFFLGQALSHLPVEDQLLIERLFWNGTRQDRMAVMLGVSQQEVSRRKVRGLRLLRQALNSSAALLLSQLGTVCLAILDDLDVILDIDLLW